MTRLTIAASMLLLVFTLCAEAQNMLTNHSFESPAFNPAFPPLLATGWTSEFPGNMYIDSINNCAACVTDGTQYQQAGSSLEQNTGVAVIPGATYRLAFDYVSFTDDPSGPATAQLFTNPTTSNTPIGGGGGQELFFEELPTGPTHTGFPQSFDIMAPGDAEGYLHVRFFVGNNYRGFDNVWLTLLSEPTLDNADFNGDGIVDAADYVVWRKFDGLMGTGTPNTGDANGDTNVDSLDYDLWREQFGTMPAAGNGGLGTAAVPEPSCAAMIVVTGLMFAVVRRRGQCTTSHLS